MQALETHVCTETLVMGDSSDYMERESLLCGHYKVACDGNDVVYVVLVVYMKAVILRIKYRSKCS